MNITERFASVVHRYNPVHREVVRQKQFVDEATQLLREVKRRDIYLHGNDIASELGFYSKRKMRRLSKRFTRSEVFKLIEELSERPEENSLALGFLFANLSLADLPAQTRNAIPYLDTNFDCNLVAFNDEYGQCGDSERLLFRALDLNNAIVLEVQDRPAMIFKFEGFRTGLVVENFTNANGRIFVAGCWYMPTHEVKESLSSVWALGTRRIQQIEGDWAFVRAVGICSNPEVDRTEIVPLARKLAYDYPGRNLTISPTFEVQQTAGAD